MKKMMTEEEILVFTKALSSELDALSGDFPILTDAALHQRLLRYAELLIRKNQVMNLTALTEPRDVARLHFADSLLALPVLQESCEAAGRDAKWMDVGTGAGFPGLVLQMARPCGQVFLLDALAKRLRFLQEVSEACTVPAVTYLHGRAEDYGQNPDYREQMDFVVARAVAALPVLAELCLPLVKVGGRFLAMKGPRAGEEVREAALRKLGAEVEAIRELVLPGGEEERSLVVLRKLSPTPRRYPRKAGEPSRAPLR